MKKKINNKKMILSFFSLFALTTPLILTSCQFNQDLIDNSHSNAVNNGENNLHEPSIFDKKIEGLGLSKENGVNKYILKTEKDYFDNNLNFDNLMDFKTSNSPSLVAALNCIVNNMKLNTLDNKVIQNSDTFSKATFSKVPLTNIREMLRTSLKDMFFVTYNKNQISNLINYSDLNFDSQDIFVDIDISVSEKNTPSNGVVWNALDVSIKLLFKTASNKWRNLDTNDPIEMQIKWFGYQGASLFKDGIPFVPMVSTSRDGSFITFTVEVKKEIFGDDLSRINNPENINKWLAGKTGNQINGGNQSDYIARPSAYGNSFLVIEKENLTSYLPKLIDQNNIISSFKNVQFSKTRNVNVTQTNPSFEIPKENFISSFMEKYLSNTNDAFLTESDIIPDLDAVFKTNGANVSQKDFTIAVSFSLSKKYSNSWWYGIEDSSINKLPILILFRINIGANSGQGS